MDELITIVVPIYNERVYLDDCIKSIINQTYKNLEIILVDDGSCKEVRTRCDFWEKVDSRIRVLHKQNEGLSSARISGYELANGNWISFVDNDDFLPKNAIEVLHKGCDNTVNISSGRRLDMEKIVIKKEDIENVSYEILDGKNICEMIGPDNQKRIVIPLWGKLYRKSFLDKIDLLKYKDICPTIFFEDVLISPILFFKANKITLVDSVCYIHREVPTSISRAGKLTNFYYEQIESGNIVLRFCKDNDLKVLYSYELKKYFDSILRIWCLMEYEEMDSKVRRNYKIKINKYYNFYLKDYIKYAHEGKFRKFYYVLFRYEKNIWTKIVLKYYFKKNNKSRKG